MVVVWGVNESATDVQLMLKRLEGVVVPVIVVWIWRMRWLWVVAKGCHDYGVDDVGSIGVEIVDDGVDRVESQF